MPTLQVNHPIINLYRPYVGFNHHHTQIGFNCEMLGDTLTILPQDIYFILRQGNRSDALPPYVIGTATSGTSTRLTDTSKNFLSSTNSWLGDYDDPWVNITGGTGAGQSRKVSAFGSNYLDVAVAWTTTPDATSTYCVGKQWSRVRADLQDQYPNLYLQHDEYTIWTMVFDSGGVPRVARNYININALLSAAPSVHNSVSPQIIFKKEDAVGGMAHVKIRAKQGDTVKLYWKYAMDEGALSGFFPDVADGTADHGSGIVLARKRGLSFRPIPLRSGVVYDVSGEIQFDLNGFEIASSTSDRWVVASATTPGYGESFSCAAVKVFVQSGPPYTPHADDMRQTKVIFTPTTTTQLLPEKGYLERKYDVAVKNVDLYTGAESDYASPSEFKWNEFNNGDAYNVPISGGIWVKVGTTKTVLIIDENANGSTAGTPFTYWSTHIIDAGTPTPATRTNYSSLLDAITRGPNTTMAKETANWYSSGWDLGFKVYINNDPNDISVPPIGYYFVIDMSMAIQIDATGTIIGKQHVGGVATF